MNEHDIRNDLVTKLELIEPGLTLIKAEYKLDNAHGAKGFIDILAKDRFGNRVIIELKRSNAAARQAIHEIFKYIALYKEQQRVAHSQIRCIIVSTDWHELLSPFSELHRSMHIQLEGVKIRVDDEGQVVDAEAVDPVEPSPPAKTFRSHHVFLYVDKEDRDRSIDKTINAFKESGGTAAFALAVDCDDGSDHVVYRHALYLVPVEITDDAEAAIRQKIFDEGGNDLSESGDLSFQVQERFGEDMILDVNADTYEIGYPEKFFGLFDLGWRATSARRFGNVPDEIAADDDEVLRWIAGVEGANSQQFEKVTSPRFHLDWNEAIEAIQYCLKGNEIWMKATEEFCNRVSKELPKATVSFQIFNPQNLAIAMFKLACRGDDRYIPDLEIVAWDEELRNAMILRGGLEWNGTSMPESVSQALHCEDFFIDFLLIVQQDSAWEFDSEILDAHGMQYYSSLMTVSGGERYGDGESQAKSNELVGRPADKQRLHLRDFCDSNPQYIDELVKEILSNSIGL